MSRMFNLKELLEGKQSVALGGHVARMATV